MDTGTALLPDEPATAFYIGHHETSRTSAVSDQLLSQAESWGYDFLTTPITTSSFHDRVLRLVSEHIEEQNKIGRAGLPLPVISPLTPKDTTLTPATSNSSRIAIAGPWIDLGSEDSLVAHISRQVLMLEVAYAAFVGISNIVILGPTEGSNVVQYGRAIHEAIGLGPYIRIHIFMPMSMELELDVVEGTPLSELSASQPSLLVPGDDEDGESDANAYGAWESWNIIRELSGYSNKLSIALELPRRLPSVHLQHRWYSEPVRLLVLPRTSFLRNAKDYPVLSKSHQQYISLYARLRFPPWLLLADVGAIQPISADEKIKSPEPTPAEAASQTKEKPKDPVPHLRYLRHLQQNQPPHPPIERFGQGYQDYLQSPLQPLTDNLESVTYEVFEKDPVKYDWYERAIANALKDMQHHSSQTGRSLVVAVVGAGRGPLVTRALQASRSTGVAIECWAVEKNPNAFVLLQHRNATDSLWNRQVHLVKSDMRHWAGPDLDGVVSKVDILVSELLGSFADNELSPECLDGVQHVLHPNRGISIPKSYSAHITPIATPRLHSDLLGRNGAEKWDIPYVVMLHQLDYLCAEGDTLDTLKPEVKEAWAFSHPIKQAQLDQSRLRAGGSAGAGGWTGGDGSNEHNARSCTLTFRAKHLGVCHGIGGYFETVLYSRADSNHLVELSTNPVTIEQKSKDMISWFPIFFPIKTPLYVPKGAEITVYMWRQSDDRSVWYEWLIEVCDIASGRRRKVGVSEMGSSRKNACLM